MYIALVSGGPGWWPHFDYQCWHCCYHWLASGQTQPDMNRTELDDHLAVEEQNFPCNLSVEIGQELSVHQRDSSCFSRDVHKIQSTEDLPYLGTFVLPLTGYIREQIITSFQILAGKIVW